MPTFEIQPIGPFSLAAAQRFAGGFPAGIGGGGVGDTSIVMSFPLEGWHASAAVELRQEANGRIVGETDAKPSDLPTITRQAARSLSLDHDGTGWPAVGDRDAVVGRFQQSYDFLRPVCFYSAYEAATSFVIGQRISMRQGARVKERLRELAGDQPTVNGRPYPAFPRPERLLALEEMPGLSANKVKWLHGLARAALDGRLDTETLRAMPRDEALAALGALAGVGPWTAEAVRLRGCGMADELPTHDEVSPRALARLYGREELDRGAFEELAEAWRPFRMWAIVLLRFSANRETRVPETGTA
jgi:DNA-3-methyladenine glycosylase II